MKKNQKLPLGTSTLGDDDVTNPNQIIDETNSQPDYYTADLNRNIIEGDPLPTTATNGLDSISDEVLGDAPKPQNKDNILEDDLTSGIDDDANRLDFASDPDTLTDRGGEDDESDSFSQDSVSSTAGMPGHWGVDEDTE